MALLDDAKAALDAASVTFMAGQYPAELTPVFLTIARQYVGDVDTLHDDDADTKLAGVLEVLWNAGREYERASR